MVVNSRFTFLFYAAFLILLGSCKEKVEPDVFLRFMFEERKIPNAANVVDFDIVGEKDFFAVSVDLGILRVFHSSDEGLTWNNLSDFEIAPDLYGFHYQSICFVDVNNGILVFDNKAFRTFDGGQTWDALSINHPNVTGEPVVIFVGKNKDNEFIIADFRNDENQLDGLYKLSSNENNIEVLGQFTNLSGDYYGKGALNNDHLYLFAQSVTPLNKRILHFDLVTGWIDSLEEPNHQLTLVSDIVYGNGKHGMIHNNGAAYFYGQLFSEAFTNKVGGVYTIDYLPEQDYFLAGGEKSIGYYHNGAWSFLKDGAGVHLFNQLSITKLKALNQEEIYLSGKYGLFAKGRIVH